eukprot:scaffold4846_cov93-Skeletonema_menzelii.AAC.1
MRRAFFPPYYPCQLYWATSNVSGSYSRRYTKKGGDIGSYLNAQIGHHQVAYKAVASRLQVQVVWAEYISVYAIITNYIGPLATAQARIHVATHIKVAKYEAIFSL